MKYEVVWTKSGDVGLLIEENSKSEPKRVLARALEYEWRDNSDREYGGVELVKWIRTGVFLSKEEWRNISCKNPSSKILTMLGITKKIYSDKKEIMIRASNQSGINKEILLNTFAQDGLMGVYNLGLEDMYDYMKG